MRTAFLIVICLLGNSAWQTSSPNPLCGQETPLPVSLKRLPQNTAFFYGIHNGTKFWKMLAQSDLSQQLVASGLSELTAEDYQGLMEGDYGGIEIDFDEAAKGTMDAIGDHQDDYEAVVKQLLTSDAILVGDDSWVTTWESIAKCFRIAKEEFSVIEVGENKHKVLGSETLLQSVAWKNLRVPNTLLSFQLTDTAPAIRLLEQFRSHTDNLTNEELGGWQKGDHPLGALGDNSLAVLSRPLDQWMTELQDNDQSEKELTEESDAVAVGKNRSGSIASCGW